MALKTGNGIKLIALAAGAALLLSGCGAGYVDRYDDEDSAGGPQMAFTMVYAGGDLAHKQGISTVVDAFERSHPNIQVTEINSGSGTYLEYLKMKDAVGEFPDLVEMRDTQMFADAGLIAELPYDVSTLFSDVPMVNGKVYNAPMELPAPQGIIYNKKIFRQAGIDREPKTFGEFLEDCEKIKKLGITPLVVGGKDIWHMGFWINKFLIDEVYIRQPDWNALRSQGEVKWTDPGPTDAMRQLGLLWKNGYVDSGFLSTADNQTASYLTDGKAAMLYSGPWMFKQILESDRTFELGFFTLPDRSGQVNVAGLPTPTGWSISTEAANDPNKLKAIKQFLYFFFSKEQYPRYLESVSGIPSTREEMAYNTSEPAKKVLALMRDPNTHKSYQINNFWGANEIPVNFRNHFYKLVQEYLAGKATLAETMIRADQEWDMEQKEMAE